MFFNKKRNDEPMKKEQNIFTSKDGRITYDRDYLLFAIEPTKEELEILVEYSNTDITIPSSETTNESDEKFEDAMTKILYNFFVVADCKRFLLKLDGIKLKNEDNKEHSSFFLCHFLSGVSYDRFTGKILFLVNPLYYHNGNLTFDVDPKIKYDVIPEIEIIEKIYLDGIADAMQINQENKN